MHLKKQILWKWIAQWKIKKKVNKSSNKINSLVVLNK